MLDLEFVFYIFKFVIFFLIILFLFDFLTNFSLNKNKDKQEDIPLFGLFMQSNNREVLALSFLLVKFFFIVFSLLFVKSLNYYFLFVFILLSFGYGALVLSIKSIVIECCSSLALYFGIFCCKLLLGYLNEVTFVWYVAIGFVLLNIFMFLYSIYFSFRNINFIISKNKYVRRIRNEDT